jgi:hypothetical protein
VLLQPRIQGDSPSPDRRWVNLLDAADPGRPRSSWSPTSRTRGRRSSSCWPCKARRLHRAGPRTDADPGQGRRRAGLRMPLRHRQRHATRSGSRRSSRCTQDPNAR